MPRGDADQRTAYIGKELDTESQLGDHGVRKVDYELGRFTTCDPLWEKYYAWSPYQYSYNNPVSLADYDGKWAVNAGVGPAFSKVNSILNTISYYDGMSQGGYASRINSFYDSWNVIAPKVAQYLRSNTIYVGKFNGSSSIGALGEFGGDRIYFNTFSGDSPRFEELSFHEILHNMGEDEYGAWGGSMAAGLVSQDDLIYTMTNLGKDEEGQYMAGYYLKGSPNKKLRSSILTKSYLLEWEINNGGKSERISELRSQLNDDVSKAVSEMFNYGLSILR